MSSTIKFPDSLNVETVNGLRPATKFLVMNNIDQGIITLTDGTVNTIQLTDKDKEFRECLSRANKEDSAVIYLLSELFNELSVYFILTTELIKKINLYIDKYEELAAKINPI
jgi:hypothetical protein